MWCDSSCAAAPCDSKLFVCLLVANCLTAFCQLFVNVSKPTSAVSCVDVRVTVPPEKSLERKQQKVKASRWKMVAASS